MYITKKIKELRKEFNHSQEKLAELLEVSRQTISNWENGRNYPDVRNLIQISDIYNISLDELIKGDVLVMKKEIEKNKNFKLDTKAAIFNVKLMFTGFSVLLLSAIVMAVIALLYAGSEWIFCTIGFAIGVFIMFYGAIKVERIKKKNSIKTYKEIVDFFESNGSPTK